jgi:tetratricopeptide (TPR) repeat protein
MRRRLLLGLCLAFVAGLCLIQPCRVQYRLWQARQALARRDAKEALVRLERAECISPNSGETQFLMARAYRRLGQMDQVRARMTRASQLGYSRETLKREELLVLAQSGQISMAHPKMLALMMDPGPDAEDVYEAIVQGSLRTFQLGPALSALDAWEGDRPNSPEPHFYRGLVLAHQSEWSRAIASFRRALQLAPERHDIRLHLARALREHYQYREAIGQYRRCVEQNDDPEGLLGWAMCLDAMGKSTEARERYLRLLDEVPDYCEARLAIGELDLSHGDAQQALHWLEPAAEQRPYELNIRLALAWALRCIGQPERARKHFEFAAKAKEASNRLRHLVRRLAKNPDNVELRCEIGATLLEYGPPSDGVVWLKSVLMLQPGHRRARALLADYYSGHSWQRVNDGVAEPMSN